MKVVEEILREHVAVVATNLIEVSELVAARVGLFRRATVAASMLLHFGHARL